MSCAQFDQTGGEDRFSLIETLRTRETGALTGRQRLDILCWLADNTSQCQTVREHLEKNADSSVDLIRERRQACQLLAPCCWKQRKNQRRASCIK